jgi:hypothetical protein
MLQTPPKNAPFVVKGRTGFARAIHFVFCIVPKTQKPPPKGRQLRYCLSSNQFIAGGASE